MRRFPLLATLFLATAIALGCEKDSPPTSAEAPVTAKVAPETMAKPASIGTPGESVVSEFNRRVQDYVAVREQVLSALDKPSNRATPKEVDAHQRALHALMAKARADAKAGDIFVQDMQTFVRGLIRRVLSEPDGARIRASLMDENPTGAKASVTVNGRYPDSVPMSTMPPDILAALPGLPKDLEYRFVGNRLILLDVMSHLIIDFVDNTFDM